MSNLKAFLKQNAAQEENMRFVASKRFLDDNKKPMVWEICAITSEQDEALRKCCTRKVAIKGRKGAMMPETDWTEYLGKLAAECTVFPNLNDKDLQDSYGIMGADKLLKVMLKPGEFTDYTSRVQEINGFDISIDDQVEDAKN